MHNWIHTQDPSEKSKRPQAIRATEIPVGVRCAHRTEPVMRHLAQFATPVLLLLLTGCDPGALLDGLGGSWTINEHPCFGNRTDVMHFEGLNNGWVGCGSTTDGYGLFSTTDGGRSWSQIGGVAETMRVNSISRAADGRLFAAGTGDNGLRIATVEGSSSSAFYTRPESGAQTWQSFQVGTFRMASDGRALAESLTGSDVMVFPDASGSSVSAAEGSNGYGWWNSTEIEGSGAQILDLELHDDRFYGVGSTINQPPYFFHDTGTAGFGLEAVRLDDQAPLPFEGEVWDLAIDDSGQMLAAGVNEDTNIGVLWFTTGDPTQTSSWTYEDTQISSDPTRFYGACRDGDLMAAVGDYSQKNDALILWSKDGGASWDITAPPNSATGPVAALSRCQIVEGRVIVTGAEGFIGVLRAD